MSLNPFDQNTVLLTNLQVVTLLDDQLGISVHPGTVARWFASGSGGVRLESVKIAGTRYTAEDSVRRFIVAIQPQDKPATGSTRAAKTKADTHTTGTRKRAAAKRKLAKAGI